VNRLGDRFASLARYRDVVLAVALCAAGEYELLARITYNHAPVWPGSRPATAVLIPLLTLPLALRRRRPLAASLSVYIVIGVSSLALGASEATTTFLVFIAATFSGAAYAGRPAIVGGAALLAGAIHEFRDPAVHGFGDAVWALGLLTISFLLGGAVHQRQRRIGSLETAAAHAERAHAEQVAAATAAERAAIARELHDIVAHAVSVIVIQSQAGSRALPDADLARGIFGTIEESARAALTDLRRLLRLLGDDEGGGGDPAAPSPSLRHVDELGRSVRAAGLDVEFKVADPLPTLSPVSDLTAYRIIQEALTNTLRHAPGATARVDIARCGDDLVINIRDSGASEGQRSHVGSGRGLIGMRERVALVGGELEIDTASSGFEVRARVPIEGPGAARAPGSPPVSEVRS
jgi:signal transduction histidine kinase